MTPNTETFDKLMRVANEQKLQKCIHRITPTNSTAEKSPKRRKTPILSPEKFDCYFNLYQYKQKTTTFQHGQNQANNKKPGKTKNTPINPSTQ